MAGWPIDERDLDELDLDIHNVRIPSGELTDSAIANYLVEAEDLLGLARDILRDGYIDNELPVVAVESGRCVVLEGNRRVTALKAIHDPLLLGKAASRMQRLLSRYPDHDVPKQIRVMFAPSRDVAQSLLARLHTRSPKRAWLREQQAVFYHAQLSSTVAVNDLRALYPSEPKIVDFIRMGEMRVVIRDLRYDDPELEQWVKTSQLKMTSLEYAYDLPKIQQALGLSFSKDGLLATKRMSRGQCRGLIYLLERFKAKTLNTRSPELKASSKEKHDQFVEELRRIVAGDTQADAEAADTEEPQETSDQANTRTGSAAPSNTGATSTTGTSTTPGGVGGASGAATSAAGASTPVSGVTSGSASGPGSRGPNRGDTRSRLDMDGFEYKGSSAGMRRRFEELKRLDVRDFSNATHDLLRTILECAIKDYFAAQGNRQLLTGKQLGTCVDELSKAFQSNQRMTSLINIIKRTGRMPASQFAGTMMSLNASNHEPDLVVTGSDVHEAWDRIKPILIEIVGK